MKNQQTPHGSNSTRFFMRASIIFALAAGRHNCRDHLPHPTHPLTSEGLRLPRYPVAETNHMQLLIAGRDHGDQLSADRHRNASLNSRAMQVSPPFRPAPVCHRGTPTSSQQAFLQALIDQHLPSRVEHDTHTDHLEGRALGASVTGQGRTRSVGSDSELPWQRSQKEIAVCKAWPPNHGGQAGPRLQRIE